MTSVVVVGAGIVGASIAYHLARLGVSVRLVDARPGPARGVTGGSFAWVGSSGGDWPGGAADLRGSVQADYARLAEELPDFSLRRCGSLVWTSGSVRPGVSMAVEAGQRLVSASEIATLEPSLVAVPSSAVYTPGDFAVDPVLLTSLLVEGASSFGASVSWSTSVESLDFGPSTTVVLAAGTGVAGLAPLAVGESPARLLRASAPPGLVRTIVATPQFEVRELRPGALVLAAPLEVEPEVTFAAFQSAFEGGASARLLGSAVGRRPTPDGGPVVGFVEPGVYVAVMHSAVTLAPTVGRLVASELATGVPVPELARCRYDRGER